MEFNNRQEIIKALVKEFGETESSFSNTATNKQREKFWTFNRLSNYLRNLRIANEK
jgi:hypothetical protein